MSKTTQRTESKLLKATTDLLNHSGYRELDVKTITSLAGCLLYTSPSPRD